MKKLVFKTLSGVALLSAVLGVCLSSAVSAHTDLRIVNFGGAMARSQMLAYIRPWEQLNQKSVEMDEYNGGIEDLRAQVEAANVKWDVVDMEYSDLIRACEDGLLEEIDHSTLLDGDDGTSAKQDFIDGALPKCGVGSVIWATVYAYSKEAFPNDAPSTIADFFDTRKFPGKRGLRRDPRGTLEWALMAAGVAPDEVYDRLATPEGLNLAFKTLDSIKGGIVWWERGPQPAAMLESGEVTMTAAWNGRLFRPIFEEKRPIEIVWDGQLWEIEMFGITKGSRRLSDALDFVRFATGTRPLVKQTNYISYGPVRKSSQSQVASDIAPLLPTAESNMKNALRFNSPWWADRIDGLRERFERWLTPVSGATAEKARFSTARRT
ncbi:MAG: ABC transporter substrate-binding protein [Gammaproteobacteria bacterium]